MERFKERKLDTPKKEPPGGKFEVLKKPPSEMSNAEIEFLPRENPERLKELGKELRTNIREKKREIRILRKKLQSLENDYKRVFYYRPPISKTTEEVIRAKAPPVKTLRDVEKGIDYEENKLKEAEAELDKLKELKKTLEKPEGK